MNKAEKIKAEIERLKNELIQEVEKGYKSEFDEGRISAFEDMITFIDSFEEEPVSNDLEEAAHSYVDTTIECFDSEGSPCCYPAFIAGAQWQKKHLEMNRIKHCDNITEEQYNLETDFLDDFIDKHDRMPTFLDAIEYGMKLQKEQDQSTIELAEDHAMLAGMEKMRQEMIDKACEWLRDNIDKYLYNTGGYEVYIPKCGGKMYADFKKAMEE